MTLQSAATFVAVIRAPVTVQLSLSGPSVKVTGRPELAQADRVALTSGHRCATPGGRNQIACRFRPSIVPDATAGQLLADFEGVPLDGFFDGVEVWAFVGVDAPEFLGLVRGEDGDVDGVVAFEEPGVFCAVDSEGPDGVLGLVEVGAAVGLAAVEVRAAVEDEALLTSAARSADGDEHAAPATAKRTESGMSVARAQGRHRPAAVMCLAPTVVWR
jgi:hypothetical protein